MIQIAAPLGLGLPNLTHAHDQHIYHDAPQHFMELLFHCLEENPLSLFSPGISTETHSSHTLFNSWMTFIDNGGSADRGLQGIDFRVSVQGYRPRSRVFITADVFQREYKRWCQQKSHHIHCVSSGCY